MGLGSYMFLSAAQRRWLARWYPPLQAALFGKMPIQCAGSNRICWQSSFGASIQQPEFAALSKIYSTISIQSLGEMNASRQKRSAFSEKRWLVSRRLRYITLLPLYVKPCSTHAF